MDTVCVCLAGEIVPGEPLRPTGEQVSIPSRLIEADREAVYLLRKSAFGLAAGTYLIAEYVDAAHTGELVLTRSGEAIYLGRFWGKHGLSELHDEHGHTIVRDPYILASVNQVVWL